MWHSLLSEALALGLRCREWQSMLLDPVRKRLHLRRIQRRDGPVSHASGGPLDEIVAVACHHRLWPRCAEWGRPDKEIDHMLLALVHQGCPTQIGRAHV